MAEEITLKVNVETGKAVTNLGNLEKATKGVTKATKQADQGAETLEQQFDTLNKEIKESPVNIRAMNKQIQKYQAIALEAGRTSPLGKKAISEAAALKDKYIDIQNEVNRLANDGVKMQAALDIGTTVIAGYAAFQGALAIAGVDSEKYRETLMKLQGAQSMLMGIETLRKNLEKESTIVLMAKNAQEKLSAAGTWLMTAAQTAWTFAIGTGSKALKLFRLALISTGIGAIVVLVGSLIANFSSLVDWVKNIGSSMGAFGKGVKKVIDFALAPLMWVIDAIKWGLQELGILESEEEKAKRERAEAEAKRTKAKLEAIANQIKELEKLAKREKEISDLRIKGLDNEIKIQKSLGKETIELERQKLKVLVESTKEQNKLTEERIRLKRLELSILYDEQIALWEQLDYKDTLDILLKNREDAFKEFDLELKQSTQNIKDAETNLLVFENNIKTERKKANTKAAEDKKKIDDKALVDAKKLAEDKLKIELKRIQDIQKLEDELFATVEQLDEEARQRLQTDQQNEIDAVNEKYFALINNTRLGEEEILRLKTQLKEEEAIINDKYAKEQLAKDQEVKDAKIQMATDSIDAIMSLTSAFAKDNEKSQKRAFEINKKLQIAQALIQTYQGVQAIFAARAASPETILFPAAPFIAAGIALATGLANVQNIRKQQFSGGSAGGSFGGGGGGGAAAPQIEPVTNTSTLVPQGPQQVYVTETDISATQNKVNVIEAQSTF